MKYQDCDFTQMKVDELRDILLLEFKVKAQEAESLKGKTNLVNRILEEELKLEQKKKGDFDETLQEAFGDPEVANLDDLNEELGEVDDEDLAFLNGLSIDKDIFQKVTEEIMEEAEVEDFSDVDYTHVRWSDKLIAFLTPEEKVGDYPTLEGLRRLVEVFIGEILTLETDIIGTPNENNGMTTTLKVSATIQKKEDGQVVVFNGAADAGKHNLDKVYGRFPTAVAESRAEARCYRRILRLKTISAEEVVKEYVDTSDNITTSQINLIELLCSRLNINKNALLTKYNCDFDTIHKLTSVEGQELCRILNSYQVTDIPEELKNDAS